MPHNTLGIVRNTPKRGDIVLASIATVLAFLYLPFLTSSPAPSPSQWVQFALAVGFIPALLWWRSRIIFSAFVLLALLGVWGVVFAYLAPINTGIPPFIVCAALPVYSVTRWGENIKLQRLCLALCCAEAFISPLMFTFHDPGRLFYRKGFDAAITLALHWLVILCVFLVARSSRIEERRRLEAAQHASEQERLLIAREVHDALAHSLTLIKVQASAGLLSNKSNPEAATDALTTIKDVAGDAIADVRWIVDSLRGQQETHSQSYDFIELIQQFQHSGLKVEITPENWHAAAQLPAGTQRALHRIIKESLTNALKHQGEGTFVQISAASPTDIAIRSSNGQAISPPGNTGFGLIGLEERARSLGGSCTWRIDGTTFIVEVHL